MPLPSFPICPGQGEQIAPLPLQSDPRGGGLLRMPSPDQPQSPHLGPSTVTFQKCHPCSSAVPTAPCGTLPSLMGSARWGWAEVDKAMRKWSVWEAVGGRTATWGHTLGTNPGDESSSEDLSSILPFPSITWRAAGMKSELPPAGWDQSWLSQRENPLVVGIRKRGAKGKKRPL